MTVLELFSGAATKAGIIEPTQTPSGPMQAFIGSRFREMIRTWSGIRNRLFFVAGVQYPTAAGVGAYLIGPGAGAAPNFDTTANPAYTRPNLVQTAQYLVGTARRWPLRILTLPGWQDLQTRNLQDPDGPTDLFYDFNHPIATINLAPKPAGVGVLFMSQWNPLPVFQDNQMQLIVEDYYPDDYLTPLTSGLAIQLWALPSPGWTGSVGNLPGLDDRSREQEPVEAHWRDDAALWADHRGCQRTQCASWPTITGTARRLGSCNLRKAKPVGFSSRRSPLPFHEHPIRPTSVSTLRRTTLGYPV